MLPLLAFSFAFAFTCHTKVLQVIGEKCFAIALMYKKRVGDFPVSPDGVVFYVVVIV